MKLLVFGATGGTGMEVVKQALEAGHSVSAFVRDSARLTLTDDKLKVIVGDVFDTESVAAAVKGQDVVVCALGAGQSLGKTSVRAIGTANLIAGMQLHKVHRLLVVTAMGTGESWGDMSWINKMFYAVLLKNSRQDHEAQEAAVKASELDWTIVRPSGLNNGPLTGEYSVGERISAKSSQISRADVADFILKTLSNSEYIGKAVTVTN